MAGGAGCRQFLRFLHGCDRHHPGGVERLDLPHRWPDIFVELRQPARIELQRRDRHRTVDIHGQYRDSVLIFEAFEPIQHFLHATDGKRGNDQSSASRRHVGDDTREPFTVIIALMNAIAVRGFDEQEVGLADRHRIGKDRSSVAAKIAAK
jgi:hypothetical protein